MRKDPVVVMPAAAEPLLDNTSAQLMHFPRWLFRHLFEVNDHELEVALAVSRRLNDLKRGEWKRLLARWERWFGRWEPPKHLLELAAA